MTSDKDAGTDARVGAIDFGRAAADYDRYRPGFPASFFERIAAAGWIAPGHTALDVGTGTGSLALGLAELGAEVTGVDPSAAMLAVARRRASERGMDVRFLEGTAENTGLDEGVFDLVTAGQCWWWLDVERTMAEVRRVLRPGGRLIIANFSYLPTPGSVAAATEALVLAHNPGWPKAGESGLHEPQVRDLDAAGFGAVESFSYIEPVTFSHEAWRGRMRACNGVGASLAPADVERFDGELGALRARGYPTDLLVAHRVFAATGTRPGPPLTPRRET